MECTEYRPLKSLREDKGIARAVGVDSWRAALLERGQTMPVVVEPSGRVLVGHALVAAMRLLQWETARCVVVEE